MAWRRLFQGLNLASEKKEKFTLYATTTLFKIIVSLNE